MALFSSGVPCIRLLDANFGRSGRVPTNTKRPLASNVSIEFGVGPKDSLLRPSGAVLIFVTIFQVPTRSLALCAKALPGSNASPKVATAQRLRIVRRFMMSSSFGWGTDYKHDFH